MPNFNDLISSLNSSERKRVQEYIASIRLPIEEWINPKSTLIGEKFAEEFKSRIGFQHSFQKGPLFRETFDAAFISSLNAQSVRVEEASSGQRFWDVEVEGRKISLKSSKAKNISPKKLHISKLSEAAWIQDCRSAKMRQEHTFNYFENYINTVNSIIQLRYFQREFMYELVEFPCSLLEEILLLPKEQFNADGPSINIPVGQTPPDYTLKIDRSDAKITLANIRKEVCIVHASWRLVK